MDYAKGDKVTRSLPTRAQFDEAVLNEGVRAGELFMKTGGTRESAERLATILYAHAELIGRKLYGPRP